MNRISLTEKNRRWLNKKFSDKNGQYQAHEPIWGYKRGYTEGGHILRFCRTLNLLRILSSAENIESLLDVGTGEGYTAALIRELIPSCKVTITDLSLSAVQKAHDLFGLRTCTSNAATLPFVDNSFDVVLCTEVIEHVARPFRTIFELMRVARKFVVITTEASMPWELYRRVVLKTRSVDVFHFDRNIWLDRDFSLMFGNSCEIYPQFPYNILYQSEPQDIKEARIIVREESKVFHVSPKTRGLIIVIKKRQHDAPYFTLLNDEKILDLLFSGPINICENKVDLWKSKQIDRLLCSYCNTKSIKNVSEAIICESCFKNYGRTDEVLDFLPPVIEDGSENDEQNAIKELKIDREKEKYLFKLGDLFNENNIENSLPLYYFYRLLRRSFRGIQDILCHDIFRKYFNFDQTEKCF